MQLGDVVRLQTANIHDSMALRVGDRKKFWCKPGQIGTKLAVQITDVIEELEHDDFEELAADEGELL